MTISPRMSVLGGVTGGADGSLNTYKGQRMPDHWNRKPAKPREGDSLSLADPIGIGDFVYWDRSGEGHLLLRRLAFSAMDSVDGEIFEVAFGRADGQVCLKLVRGAKTGDK